MKGIMIYVLVLCVILSGCSILTPETTEPVFSQAAVEDLEPYYSEFPAGRMESMNHYLKFLSDADATMLRRLFETAIKDYVNSNGIPVEYLPSPEHFIYLLLMTNNVDQLSEPLDYGVFSVTYTTDLPQMAQGNCPFAVNVHLGENYHKTPITLYCSEECMYVGRGTRCYYLWDIAPVLKAGGVSQSVSKEESLNSLTDAAIDVDGFDTNLARHTIWSFFRYANDGYPLFRSARTGFPHDGMPSLEDDELALYFEDANGNEYGVFKSSWSFYLSVNGQSIYYWTTGILIYPEGHPYNFEVPD